MVARRGRFSRRKVLQAGERARRRRRRNKPVAIDEMEAMSDGIARRARAELG
jgi:REP element-mobilizing transposase RayT